MSDEQYEYASEMKVKMTLMTKTRIAVRVQKNVGGWRKMTETR